MPAKLLKKFHTRNFPPPSSSAQVEKTDSTATATNVEKKDDTKTETKQEKKTSGMPTAYVILLLVVGAFLIFGRRK